MSTFDIAKPFLQTALHETHKPTNNVGNHPCLLGFQSYGALQLVFFCFDFDVKTDQRSCIWLVGKKLREIYQNAVS